MEISDTSQLSMASEDNASQPEITLLSPSDESIAHGKTLCDGKILS